eukprot:c20655_g3_i1.p1 GENE.c20655_g3_i1~~c20655_g3_i1.p1  ORF type:complete len:227 (-),score=99.90 c20655_g3_i1:66-746(-)
MNSPSGVIPTPQVLLRNEIHLFLWNARQVFPVNIFKCECYVNLQSNVRDVITVPFCHFIEISTRVDTIWSKSSKSIDVNTTPMNTELCIQFSQMNPQGIPYRDNFEVTGLYCSVLFSNISTDEAAGASPSTGTLELIGKEPEKRGKKSSLKGAGGPMSCGPLHHHICEAIVKAPKVHEAKKTFNVLIDSKIIQNCHKIKVSRLKDGGDEFGDPVSIPFVTYLPMNT